jgi:hypothetical protein
MPKPATGQEECEPFTEKLSYYERLEITSFTILGIPADFC